MNAAESRWKADALEVGRIIGETLPKGIGFALLTFTLGRGGDMTWMSNADRGDMMLALRELADLLEEPAAAVSTAVIAELRSRRKQHRMLELETADIAEPILEVIYGESTNPARRRELLLSATAILVAELERGKS